MGTCILCGSADGRSIEERFAERFAGQELPSLPPKIRERIYCDPCWADVRSMMQAAIDSLRNLAALNFRMGKRP